VKANDQALPGPELDAILAKVEQALAASPLFRSAARPKALTKLMLSRYRVGQTYGLHVDDALMQGLRTDLSFTLFLSDPDSYDGGALIIEDTFEARAIKLEPGEVILYPSTTLHRVEPVSRGERLAVVGWVQSLIRDGAQREVLFDLDQAVEACFAAEGKTEQFDRLAKTRANLLRMWAEV
jgi:PKHD-type hydroxylase